MFINNALYCDYGMKNIFVMYIMLMTRSLIVIVLTPIFDHLANDKKRS